MWRVGGDGWIVGKLIRGGLDRLVTFVADMTMDPKLTQHQTEYGTIPNSVYRMINKLKAQAPATGKAKDAPKAKGAPAASSASSKGGGKSSASGAGVPVRAPARTQGMANRGVKRGRGSGG